MATQSAPWMTVSPSAFKAATAKAMAIRWSSCESISAPCRRWLPFTRNPSSNSSTSAPMARRLVADHRDAIALLDAQFLCIADLDAVPSVRPDGGKHWQLVDKRGGERASDPQPGQGRCLSIDGSTSSPCCSWTCRNFVFAPIEARTSRIAARVGFNRRASTTRLDCGNSAAAQRKNAAEEMSPGTTASIALNFAPPCTVTRLARRSTWAPKAFSAISPWSRVRTDSSTLVSPDARAPAKSIHDLTCALGTGVV